MNIAEKLIKPEFAANRQKIIDKIRNDGVKYGIYPLSPNQYSLWCSYEISQGKSDFTNPCFAVVINNVSYEKIIEALKSLFKIEEVLRYRFVKIEDVVYQYADTDAEIIPDFIDISGNVNDAEISAHEHIFYRTPFDLINGYPVRAAVLKLSEKDYELMFSLHHIISDAMSVGVFLKDLYSLLEGKMIGTKSGFGQFAAYKNYGRGLISQLNNEEYWISKISDIDKNICLPTDNPRGQHGDAAVSEVVISGEYFSQIGKIALKLQSNVFVVLPSLFSVIIHHLTHKNKMIIATTFFNRKKSDTIGLIGDFASIVPYVFDFRADMSLSDYIRNNTDEFYKAMDYSDVTYSRIARRFSDTNCENVNPLYQVAMVYHKSSLIGMDIDHIGDMKIKLKDLAYEGNIENISTDLYVKITDYNDSLNISVLYNKKLFRQETIAELLDNYKYMIGNINDSLNSPISEIPLSSVSRIDLSEKSVFPESVRETVVNKEIRHSFYSDDKEIVILSKEGITLPKGYYGDVLISDGNKFYETGRVGRVNCDNCLDIDEERTYIIRRNSKIIDLRKVSSELKKEYQLAFASFDLIDNRYLIFYYVSEEADMTANAILEEYNISPDLIYRTSAGYPLIKLRPHILNLLSVRDKLKAYCDEVIIIQKDESDTFDVIMNGSKAPSKNIITDVCTSVRDRNINYLFRRKSENTEQRSFRYNVDIKDQTEEKLCRIWEDLLELNNIDKYDSFYNCGGDSLKVYSLLGIMQKEFGIPFNISDLFTYNSIHDMSRYINKIKETKDNTVHDQTIVFF